MPSRCALHQELQSFTSGKMLALRPLASARARVATRARALCSSPRGVNYKDGLEYSQRQDKTGRPISPHVFIYRFPTIAISSITVRITGGMASFGFFGVAGLALLGDGQWAINTVQDVADYAPAVAKFSVAYVLSYQWLGSARHLFWDWTARGFNNTIMYQGALAMFGATAVISAALAMYSLPPLEETPTAARKEAKAK